MKNEINVRLLALETLLDSDKNKIYTKDALNKTLFQNQFLSKTERSFLSRLVEGTTEYRILLDYVINQFSKTPVNKCKPVIRMILRMGVYQILFMDRVPKEAVCNESVKLAKKKGFVNLSGFVNGVLRNIVRNLDHISYPDEKQDRILAFSIRYSMPQWIVKKLVEWYGAELTKKILQKSLEASDLSVRVNLKETSKQDFIGQLEEKDIQVSDGYYVEEALHLKHINYVLRVPGYRQGLFFVQDESSMLLYHVIENYLADMLQNRQENKLDILDICAAPGGKTTHFAQMLGDRANIEARDLTEKKADKIRENIERLHLSNVSVGVKDATQPDADWINCADVVIADVPCSGLGILGKKNDIKYHLEEKQLLELVTLQRTILKQAMQYVKPNGILLFSTCTLNPEENEENAKWISKQGMFQPLSIRQQVPQALKHCLTDENMMQLIQGREECDGFFIAAFQRI